MLICPNCNHHNPDGAVQCEACYTPLPTMTTCPSCGTPVQADASFCGQCGANLKGVPTAEMLPPPPPVLGEDEFNELLPPPPMMNLTEEPAETSPDDPSGPDVVQIPDLLPPDPLIQPDPISPPPISPPPLSEAPLSESSAPLPVPDLTPSSTGQPNPPSPNPEASATEASVTETSATEASANVEPGLGAPQTQLQRNTARLLHVQTDALIEFPDNLTVIRIGKPNDRVPPDIDVSGFPDSEIVSRVHANIRIEGNYYYIEDVGSSNGTYINNMPLPYGNRHRLRPGDRIALGKGDKLSFIFQIA